MYSAIMKVLGWNEASSCGWWYHPYFLSLVLVFLLRLRVLSPSPYGASRVSRPCVLLGFYTHTYINGYRTLGVHAWGRCVPFCEIW